MQGATDGWREPSPGALPGEATATGKRKRKRTVTRGREAAAASQEAGIGTRERGTVTGGVGRGFARLMTTRDIGRAGTTRGRAERGLGIGIMGVLAGEAAGTIATRQRTGMGIIGRGEGTYTDSMDATRTRK
jgi:hypothetical protein